MTSSYFSLLTDPREDVTLLKSRQIDQFERTDATLEQIKKLLEPRDLHLSPNQAHTQPRQENGRETPHQISEEHETTRAHITDAITKALESRGINYTNPLHLTNPKVTEEWARQFAQNLMRLESQILERLAFPLMGDRQTEIAQAEASTFQWIYQESRHKDTSWSNISEWLRSGDGLYWITGKAGSGKSTLMKYLFLNVRTLDLLRYWAKDTLQVAGFFFWNSGGTLQKTQSGLIRALLHQCLTTHRELIPVVFPDLATVPSDLLPTDYWTESRLKDAFMTILKQKLVPMRICFFIDGLDEYTGNHAEMAEMLKFAASLPNIKVCVSSRPYVVFERQFKGFPGLMLQDLTYADIKSYVRIKFSNNELMSELEEQEPGLRDRLASEVVIKASGVFLWVRLVVNSLLEGISNYDRASDLQRRLDELPSDLEELYMHMLKSVKPAFYLEQAAKLLLIIHAAERPLSLLQLSWADSDDPQYCFQIGYNEISEQKQEQMATAMEGRLKSRCLGLLEVSTIASRTMRSKQTVQFMHQSVADFIERTEVRKRMSEYLRGCDFDPNVCLMRSCILLMKHLPTEFFASTRQPGIYLKYVWFEEVVPILLDFMVHAMLAERANSIHIPAIDIITKFDQAASHVWSLYLHSEVRFNVSRSMHWSESIREGPNYKFMRPRKDWSGVGDPRSSLIGFMSSYGGTPCFVRACLEGKVKGHKPTNAQLDFAIDCLNFLFDETRQMLLEARGFRVKAYIQPKLPKLPKLKVFSTSFTTSKPKRSQPALKSVKDRPPTPST